MRIRRSADRGQVDHGWLDTRHTFSWDDFQDPAWERFGHLEVINEDRVQGGQGFKTHGHEDMEIITYVVSGAVEHRDSLGTVSIMHAGDVQRMSAGTGVTHSELSHFPDTVAHFLQIWIEPDRLKTAPAYDQRHFHEDTKRNRLQLIASSDGRDGSIAIQQDAIIHASLLDPGHAVAWESWSERRTWIQVVAGGLTVNGHPLTAGDGAAVTAHERLAMTTETGAEFLLFDLAL